MLLSIELRKVTELLYCDERDGEAAVTATRVEVCVVVAVLPGMLIVEVIVVS